MIFLPFFGKKILSMIIFCKEEKRYENPQFFLFPQFFSFLFSPLLARSCSCSYHSPPIFSGIFLKNIYLCLKDHREAVHENVRYPCDLCHMEYTTKSNLNEHKQIKHEDHVILCDQCDYKVIINWKTLLGHTLPWGESWMIFPLLSTIFNLPSGLFSLSLLFSNCYLTLSFSFFLYSTLTLRTPNSRGSQGVFLIKLCLEIELKAMTITRRHFSHYIHISFSLKCIPLLSIWCIYPYSRPSASVTWSATRRRVTRRRSSFHAVSVTLWPPGTEIAKHPHHGDWLPALS